MGVAIDIDIVPKAHALLSASSAERWLTCTPSVRIEELLPDRGSAFASDGTAAHAFAELRLRYLLRQITRAEYLAGYEATKMLYSKQTDEWTHTDWDAITSYVDYVMAEVARLDADVTIEARVDYSKYAQDGFGTSDALLVSETFGIVKSIDLKFGKGVAVSAKDNAQAKLYALGGVLGLKPEVRKKIKSVEWTIHQPRLGYVGEDSMTARELVNWATNVVAPAAKLAYEGKGNLVPSEKGCRFCKAAATCRARVAENILIARRDFMPLPDIRLEEVLMDMDEVAKILPKIDGWMAWANALKAYALTQVRDNGAEVPGFKLVHGRANRAWNVEGGELVASLKVLEVSETDIYVQPEPSVRSVAQLEKAVGKAKFKPIAAKLVSTPLGTPALVPDSDPREAVNRTADALKEFGL